MSHDIWLIESMFQITARDFRGSRRAEPSQELVGRRVTFLFQNVGLHPRLGGKHFNTVPALDVSLFLLDSVHKVHQSIIFLIPFCVGTVSICTDPTHKPKPWRNVCSAHHKPSLPLELN